MCPDYEDHIFNRVVSDISIMLSEITLTISDCIETISPVESELVASLGTTEMEITETTRFKKKIIIKKNPDL